MSEHRDVAEKLKGRSLNSKHVEYASLRHLSSNSLVHVPHVHLNLVDQPGKMYDTSLVLWRLTAALAELLLLATHLKVLLCVGKPYNPAELSSKRWTYFLFDAVSPWNSLAALLAGNTSLVSSQSTALAALLPLLFVVALGHGALHLYYIATWNRQHAGNVIKMSAVTDMRSRWQRFNAREVVWFLVGTSYDIITHAVIASLLVQQLLRPHTQADLVSV